MRWWLLGFLHRVLDRGSAGAGYRALWDCWEHRVCFCLQPQICRSQAQLLQHSQVPLNLWHSLLGKLESKLLQNWKFGDKKWCNVRVLKEVFNKDCYKCQYRVFLWKCQMQYCYSSDLKCKFLRFYQPKDMTISISTLRNIDGLVAHRRWATSTICKHFDFFSLNILIISLQYRIKAEHTF